MMTPLEQAQFFEAWYSQSYPPSVLNRRVPPRTSTQVDVAAELFGPQGAGGDDEPEQEHESPAPAPDPELEED